MLSWLRNLVTVSVTFGASWTGAVWYWRANNRMPGGADLAFWLLAVPLALLLAAWGGRMLYRRAAAASAAAGTATTIAAPAAGAPSPGPAPAALAIVAGALRSPHGASAPDLRAALAAGSARPALDPELVDDYGYPILSARIADADADVAALRDALAQAGFDAALFTEAQWRALAFGDAVAAELAGVLALHPQREAHAARIDKRAPSPLPVLQLHLVWSGGWSAAQRSSAAGWLRLRLADGGWPLEQIALAPDQSDPSDPAAPLQQLLADAGSAGPAPLLAVVLALGSLLDAATVDAMAAAGTLFSARTPQGQVPGEGACALLLADAGQAGQLAADATSLPALRAFASGRLAQSADAPGRAHAPLLADLLARALDTARCPAEQVVLAAADADHRSRRVLELMALATGRLPRLDPAADLVRTGDACGTCPPVGWLTALALAADAAREHGAAALGIGNLDPFRRDVAVVAVSNLQPAGFQP